MFSAMTVNLPCDKHTTLINEYVSEELHVEFTQDDRLPRRLEKGERSRAIEHGPQELGRYRPIC